MKKGDISLNYVIVAAIALVVLVVIILFFTGGLKTLFSQQKDQTLRATDQDFAIWRGQCELYCSLNNKASFCNNEFKKTNDKGEVDGGYKCSTGAGDKNLNVECKSFTC
ncbi:hypothetical protein FJZ53_04100 [Candidatus Woesearchaeota archaeon]|nr:hypothetical protein [Candidatus Woesearchaeota archaeon]